MNLTQKNQKDLPLTIQATQPQESEEDHRLPTHMTLTIQTTQPQEGEVDHRIPTQMTLTTNEKETISNKKKLSWKL